MLAAISKKEMHKINIIMGICFGVCRMMSSIAPRQVMGAFIIIRILPLMKFWIWVTSLVIRVMMEEGCSLSIFSKESVCTFR